ncbi:trypsin-like [Phlebotomus argentipes]|uniref:trypsin-like n=1 Tax=Phlebotomus argentipes TaxID=94469 RepID=UPI0028937338|nr:trypsin-like [Phlebotomus argentipes]
MESQWIALSVFLGVWLCLAGASSPFQVSIRLYNDVYSAGQDNFHLCSGAIVHQNYVLTTGHCVRETVLFPNSSRLLTPQMIYVVAGNLSSNATTFTSNVKKITTHKDFNAVTLEHDIALVELQNPLPLQNNSNVKWIQLDNGEVARSPCFVSILNETNVDFKTLPNDIIDIWHCNRSANFSSAKRDDICAQYTVNGGSWCGTTDLQYKFSPDRGSALVCNKVLIGLLSSIDPPADPFPTDCLQPKRTYAFYTTVEEYVPWINMVIGLTHGKPPAPPPTNMFGKDKNVGAAATPGVAVFAALALVFLHMNH